MKKKNIILSFVLGVTLVSCSDFLDMEKDIKDRLTIEEVFSKKDYTEQWLASAYSYLSNSNADMGFGGEWPFGFCDDIYHPTYKNLVEKTYLEGQWQTSWKNSYQGIRQATIFMQNVDRCEQLTEAQRIDYKAQARFIRAFYYWKLLQKYGPIPLVPDDGQDYTKDYEDLYLSRNTYDECVEFITSELVEAAYHLPDKREMFNVARPTRGAALAVRAKVLLYAASPLMNGKGGSYAESLVDDKGQKLLSTEYDEEKWAKAVAAAKDVINLKMYELYHVARRNESDVEGAYPATLPVFEDHNFSMENWPKGYADIDPFESYRSLFNGELMASENPELIFTRGQNQGDYSIKRMIKEQLPFFAKGNNRLCMTQKQCDAYYMANGEDLEGMDAEISGGYGLRTDGFVTKEDVDAGRYKPLVEGVSLQYANREPRFYASVAYNGANWALKYATETKDRAYKCWYYQGGAEQYTGSKGLCTGIGVMKFVRPTDTMDKEDESHLTNKVDVAIRYAEILLIYAEALNELQNTYSIPSWDSSVIYDIVRTEANLKEGIQPIRIRAGLPDYEEYVYKTPNEFRKKLKRERQIEFMGEGHRYFDLRRWMDAEKEESMPIYGCNTKMSEKERVLFHRPVQINEIHACFSEKTYFWPISIDELYRNRKLTQNPGWQNSKQ